MQSNLKRNKKVKLILSSSIEYPESDSPINIKIIGLDDDSPDQQTKFRIDLEDDEEEKQQDSTAQNDNIGKISIPIDFNESEGKHQL